MKKRLSSIGFYVIIGLLLLLAVILLSYQKDKEKMTYSDVLNYFESGQVKSFKIDSNLLSFELYDNPANPAENKLSLKKEFQLYSVELFILDTSETIAKQRQAGTLSYDIVPPVSFPWWLSFIPYVIMIVIVGLMFVFMFNQMQGGGKGMPFTKIRTKLGIDEKHRVSFDDVAGADEEKEELAELVEFLKTPKKYTDLGARIPKGVLLIGPPGTGKTLIAKAVAGEAGVPFFSISGSDFVELYVGVGASRVRDLFDQAKRNAPCIIFIDEIDAVGRHRGAGLGGGHDEREQTLNQLLVEMDGFGVNEGVIILAATNRPDILDPALLRPGRFDRQVMVGSPDVKGREEILKVHSRKKKMAPDVNLGNIAKTTAGFTGAELENLLNEAALLAARGNKKYIENSDIEEAVIKVVAGVEKKSKVISEKEKKLTAYHEAGHAIVTRSLPSQDPVHQISIIPRGMAGGYTMSIPKEDKYFKSKNEMKDTIVTLLGGRVAEKLALDDISTGASNDIQRATTIARKMVTQYGMSEKLGPIVFGGDHQEVFLGRDFATHKNYSEDTAATIDAEVKSIIDSAYARASEILTSQMEKLHHLASVLFEQEKVSGEEFEVIFKEGPQNA